MALVVVVCCCPAFAQKADSNSISYNDAVTLYHQSLRPETGLYNGIEYIDYAHSIQDGTPFFDIAPFGKGSVVYYGVEYKNVSIAYDIVKGEVVIYDEPHLYKIVLHKSGVGCFTTSGYSFIHLTKDSTGAKDMNAGYYEVLYDGKTRLLKKETRSVQENLAANGLSKKYILSSADYFVWKDNTYHSVNSKAALASLFNKKKEWQQWMKKNKMKFGRDKDETLARSAAWYDAHAQ